MVVTSAWCRVFARDFQPLHQQHVVYDTDARRSWSCDRQPRCAMLEEAVLHERAAVAGRGRLRVTEAATESNEWLSANDAAWG